MPDRNVNAPDSRLSTIAGHWATSGSVIGDPAVPIIGTDIYGVLAGGYFVVHHVDVTVGSHHVRAIEIIGEPDPDGDGFLARSFDNDGNAEIMRVAIDDHGAFHFSGGGDIAPAAQLEPATGDRVRSTLTIGGDGHTMQALWERSSDGISWQPWMELVFTRTEPPERHLN